MFESFFWNKIKISEKLKNLLGKMRILKSLTKNKYKFYKRKNHHPHTM